MAFGRIAAALLLAALAPGAAPAQTDVTQFVEAFRAGCLAHLPDFAGSPAAFEGLGFAPSGPRFKRADEGPDMVAEVYRRTVDAGRGCVLASEVAADAEVIPTVEAMVADLSGDAFRRREAEQGGRRVEAFSWQSDGWEVLVVVLPRVSGMQALNVTVGEAR